jgi:hypothetical protein
MATQSRTSLTLYRGSPKHRRLLHSKLSQHSSSSQQGLGMQITSSGNSAAPTPVCCRSQLRRGAGCKQRQGQGNVPPTVQEGAVYAVADAEHVAGGAAGRC